MVSIILKDLKINKTYFFNKSKIKNVQANKNKTLPIVAAVLPTLPIKKAMAESLNKIQPNNCNFLLRIDLTNHLWNKILKIKKTLFTIRIGHLI